MYLTAGTARVRFSLGKEEKSLWAVSAVIGRSAAAAAGRPLPRRKMRAKRAGASLPNVQIRKEQRHPYRRVPLNLNFYLHGHFASIMSLARTAPSVLRPPP